MSVSSRRSHALDALRGYAIATMILSATEAFTVLPRWMYHAQVPPPDHVFNPTVFGITWVDIIFPFFLFSMGAAIPLSIGRQHDKGATLWRLAWKTVVRWFKLTFFAIFIIHAFPFMLGYEHDWLNMAVPMCAFLLLCLMLIPNPFHLSPKGAAVLRWSAWIAATVLMLVQPYAGGAPFRLTDSDCIMLILANVSLTGSLIYLFTIHRPWHRLALLPFIAAIFMSAHTDGSWPALLTHTSLASWLYNPAYQEYLLIIIPGTVAGEWISQWLNGEDNAMAIDNSKGVDNLCLVGGSKGVDNLNVEDRQYCPSWSIALLSLAIIVTNVTLLFGRHLTANLIATMVLCALSVWLTRHNRSTDTITARFWQHLAHAGSYLLLLGLCLEAYEGGIRKDDVTLSYLFVTCGLALFALLLLTILCDHYRCRWLSVPLEAVGKNPMVAYVSSSMVIIPSLTLMRLYPYIDALSAYPLTGFLKGLVLTTMCMAFTAWFTHKRWFWKT